MRAGRRGFLGSSLAAGVSLVCDVARADDVASVRQANLDRFIKMRGALDGQVVIGGVKGQYNGVVDGKTTPLFGVISAVFSRYKALDGGYGVVEFEEAYYTDLETGKVLSELRNPYTNESVAVPAYDGSVDKVVLTDDFIFHNKTPFAANVQYRHFVEGPQITGDNISFIERVSAKVGAAAGTQAFEYTDYTVLNGKLRDVDQTASKMAGCKTHFEATCSWRPWLKMGDRSGYMTATGQGRFGVRLTDLPEAWLDETSTAKPELLKNLESRLQ